MSELLNSRETELSVLGSIMYDSSLYSRLASSLTPDDFFYPEHGHVYGAMAHLFEEGLDINVKSVWNHLYSRGYTGITETEVRDMLGYRVDGEALRAFVSQLSEFSGHRLLESGIRRIQASLAKKTGTLESHCSELGNLVRQVTAKDVRSEFSSGAEIASSFMELLERDRNVLAYTGIPSIDDRLVDFDAKEISYIAARPGTGKASSLDSLILTPDGWVTMGDMYVGAEVIGGDGTVQRVSGVFPQGLRDEYELTFSDGTTARADLEHLWVTKSRRERKDVRNGSTGAIIREYNSRPYTTKTTKEIMETLRCTTLADNRLNHSVPYVQPVQMTPKEVTLDPYLLGILLGDGYMSSSGVVLTNGDEEIIEFAKSFTGTTSRKWRDKAPEVRFLRASGIPTKLEELGLTNKRSWEKFIPESYLYNSIEVRKSVLQGLLDTDGWVDKGKPSIEYSTSSPHLRDGVAELVRGLGGRATYTTRMGRYKKNGKSVTARESYRMNLSFPEGITPFRLARKADRYVPRVRLPDKYIIDVRPTGRKVEMQCIMVDSEEHTYVTDGYNVTHNTAMMLQSTRVNLEQGARVGFLSMEMSVAKLANRLISSKARFNGEDMLKMTRQEFMAHEGLMNALEWYGKAPLFIDDLGPFTLPAITQKIRKMVYEHGVDVVYIDYIGLIQTPGGRSRNDELSTVSRELKGLSSELDIPLVIASQLSRDVVKRGSHRPNLADLRDSGSLEQDASIVAFLYPDSTAIDLDGGSDMDTYLKEQEAVPVKFEIAKQRNGPVFTRDLTMIKPFGRFELRDVYYSTFPVDGSE